MEKQIKPQGAHMKLTRIIANQAKKNTEQKNPPNAPLPPPICFKC